jgi:hypothetical protein
MKLKPGCQNWRTIQNQSQICDISVGEGDDDRAIFSVRARFDSLWWWEWWSAANFSHSQTHPRRLPIGCMGANNKSWYGGQNRILAFENKTCNFVAHRTDLTIARWPPIFKPIVLHG